MPGRRRALAIAVVALAAGLTAAPAPARAEERWYGWQVGATDVGAWALIVTGVALEANAPIGVGLGGLFLGGPIVHAAHGNYGRAGISLAARGGGALVGGLLGAAAAPKKNDLFGLGMLASIGLGAFLGYAAAAVVDIAVVAREEVDPATAPRMLSFGGRF